MPDVSPVTPDAAFTCSKKGLEIFGRYFILWLILGGILWLTQGNLNLFKWVHTHHQPVADLFFRFFTIAGTATVIIPVLLAVYWFRFRNRYFLILALATQIGSLLVNQAMKSGFARPRPVALYGQEPWFHYISGEVLHRAKSFPSGHTAGAFAFVFLLSLLIRKQEGRYVSLLFLAAILVGYSRMYLGQHFYADIYVGSIEGVLVCMLVLFGFYKTGYCKII